MTQRRAMSSSSSSSSSLSFSRMRLFLLFTCGLWLLLVAAAAAQATTVAATISIVVVDAATGTRMLQNVTQQPTETTEAASASATNTTTTNNATAAPTNATVAPTTASPTESPAPSPSPSDVPTSRPSITAQPTTASPTESPAPSPAPSDTPTTLPSTLPSMSPTLAPSISERPSLTPSTSLAPTLSPSQVPSQLPSVSPSMLPSTRPSLVTLTSDSFHVQLILLLELDMIDMMGSNATTTTELMNATFVDAFEQATAAWIDAVVMQDGSLSSITVTVTAQELKPIVVNGTTAAATAAGGEKTSAENKKNGNAAAAGGGTRNRRNLQQQQQHLEQQRHEQQHQVYWEVEMDVDATYSGPDANFDLHQALDPLIQAHDDDWMRNLADAAPAVFESLRPASMAAIFGDDPHITTTQSAPGMSTGGYVTVIIVSIMALSLGLAASVFVVKAARERDLLSAKSLQSPSPSYNMSIMDDDDEEYPLQRPAMMNMMSIVPPVSEQQSESSPLRGAEVAPSPSSCSSNALDCLGCGTRDYDDDEDMENKPPPAPSAAPTSPNAMEKGPKKVYLAGNNKRLAPVAGGKTSLFDSLPYHNNNNTKPAPPSSMVLGHGAAADGDALSCRQDPPSFSEVDFGGDANDRSLFDAANKSSSSLLFLSNKNNNSHNNQSHHQHHQLPVAPSTMIHAHPRDPLDRGIGSSMLHHHPDPMSSPSRFDPMNMDKMSEASSSWYDNNRPSDGRVSSAIAARIAQFEKNSDPGGVSEAGGRELKLTKSSGGTLGATAVDRSAAGTGSDLSSHARDFFSSILGGGPNDNAGANGKSALGSDAENSAGSSSNSNTSSSSRKGLPPANPNSSHHQRKPSYESLLRRGGAGLYDVFAPAGPIGIVVDTTSNGPAVHSLRNTSPMVGLISPGDLIVGLDDEDTRSMTAATLTRRMAQKANQKERKITLLTLDGGY